MGEGMRLEQKIVTGLLLAVVLVGSVAGNAYRYLSFFIRRTITGRCRPEKSRRRSLRRS